MRSKLLTVPLFLLFLAAVAQAGGSQSLLFDSNGNQSRGAQTRQAAGSAGAFRYSAPEGVDLRKNVSYEYYPVFAKTFSEAMKSTEENGPFRQDLKRRLPTKIVWGFGISFQYDYTYAVDEEDMTTHVALGVREIKVSYNITVTLPALIDSTALNPIERGMWKAHFKQLLEHEYDHMDIIEDNAAKDEALAGLAGTDYLIFDYREDLDVDKAVDDYLRGEALEAAKVISNKTKERLREYDNLTGFGSKHGMRGSFFREKSN